MPRKRQTSLPNEPRARVSMSNDIQEHHVVVAVEWDGKPPKMTYYDRLHRMGIYVQGGDRDEVPSPLARRQGLPNAWNAKAICFQEGLFICQNADVAKTIADMADEYGAAAVYIGKMYLNEFRLTERDVQVLERYKQATSRRGPKPANEKGRYIVTCFNEVATFELDLEASPANCPSCGSYHFLAKQSKNGVKLLEAPDWKKVKDRYSYWLCTRFGETGNFEIPIYAAGKQKGHPAPTHYAFDPQLPKLDVPKELLSDLKSDPDLEMQVYDNAFCLTRFTQEERSGGRMDVVNAYIISGGTKSLFMGLPNAGKLDLIDLCVLDRSLMRYIEYL